jgi:hypothetical protein
MYKYLLCDLCTDCKSKRVLYNNEHYNRHFIDLYSISHINAGIIYSIILKKPEYVFIASIIFEIIENTYIANFFQQMGFKSTNDTLINSVGDTFFVMLGYVIYSKVEKKFNLIILILIVEILMCAYMKDYSMSYLMFLVFNQGYKNKFNKDLVKCKSKVLI